MLPNKQFKIAGETLYIYAPLANWLGLYKIKTELENLSFRYEHPEEYREIEKKLEATAVERDKVFKEFTAPIRAQLDKMGLKYRILAASNPSIPFGTRCRQSMCRLRKFTTCLPYVSSSSPVTWKKS